MFICAPRTLWLAVADVVLVDIPPGQAGCESNEVSHQLKLLKVVYGGQR